MIGLPTSIDTKACFVSSFANGLPGPTVTLTECLIKLCDFAKSINPATTEDALKNARGTWFEWLLAICAWNARASSGKTGVAITLPNISAFDCGHLYVPHLQSMIQHLNNEVAKHGGELITSNPDFVLLKLGAVVLPALPPRIATVPNAQILTDLDSLYKGFIGQCGFDDVVGYLAAKVTLRPDRRLQIAHEGSLTKALYKHLQTRQWVTMPVGIKYYAMVTRASAADHRALRTVATHSVVDVSSIPQRAVDSVLEVPTLGEAELAFSIILPS